MTDGSGIHLETHGRGEPLLLIHGTGGSGFHWQPVLELLAPERKLLVVDLPGHGRSAPPPAGQEHTPAGYARALAELLDQLDLETAHACGNSVGGWTALELAKLGRARSVVAIAPAGLWARHDPWRCTLQLSGQYRMGRLFAPLMRRAMQHDRLRGALMRGSLDRGRAMPAEAATRIADDYSTTATFRQHLRETRRARFKEGQQIDVPVTVAWGAKERLIPPKARLRDELPPQTRYVELDGCGHLAMWDDPELVAKTILEGTAISDSARSVG
jgi:pimeloyl-ACP methyl ester carboxylesterase